MILAHKGVAASNMAMKIPFDIKNMPTIATLKGAYWISSNIAIAILNFSLLLPI